MATINNPTYAKIHSLFIKFLEGKSKSNSTIIAYSKDIEQLLNYFVSQGLTNLNIVELDNLKNFENSLRQQNYTNKSISRKINSIRTFYKFLLAQGVINENPSERLSHPKIDSNPPRVLTELEYRTLRDICRVDTRLYTIIEILLQTGIRISELANLYLEDIKAIPGKSLHYLYIREYASNPSRKVPLNPVAHKAIQEYLQIRPDTDDDHLFVTKNARPLLVRNIRTAIDKAFEKANIKGAKVNDLRNTFIAHHLANGVSLVAIQKIVGHKRLSTTEKYLDLLANSQKEQEDLNEL